MPAKTRAEYITLDRLIKYGGADNCRGCEMLTSRHSKKCRDRFNRLIKADKPVPVGAKPTPITAETILEEDKDEPSAIAFGDLMAEELVPERPPASDAESLGGAPTTPRSEEEETESASFALAAQKQAKEAWKQLSRVRRLATDLPGVGVLKNMRVAVTH